MKIFFLVMLATIQLFAADAIIVSAGAKLDAYDADTMDYLGKFSDIKYESKFVLTPSALLQLKSGDLLVAGGASAHKFEGKFITMVKISKDGVISSLAVKQDSKSTPINSPKRILELNNGEIIVLNGTGEINRFSATGEYKGDFFQNGVDKALKSKIQDIVLYNTGVVVTSYQLTKKLGYYNEDGSFVQYFDQGNDEVKSPSAITKIGEEYLLVDTGYNPKKITLLDKYLIYKKDAITKDIMKPTLAIKNDKTGEYIVIDEGRTREDSYDDNLEIFKDFNCETGEVCFERACKVKSDCKSDDCNNAPKNCVGVYQKSRATYKDGLLRTMIYFKDFTKTFK